MSLRNLSIFLTILATTAFVAPTFVRAPSLAQNTGTQNWTVDFEVSENTDVEVAIVRLPDSAIVRHLAAGVLGANPPSPLTANTLHQTLTWDGKNDLGVDAALVPTTAAVRVRAGMSASLDKMVGGNPYAFKGGTSGYWSFQGMNVGLDGNLYVLGSSDACQGVSLRKYDGAGNYLMTVYPWPANLTSAQVSGFGVNNWANGKVAPKTTKLPGPDLSNTIVSKQTSSIFSIGGPGEVVVADLGHLKILKVNTDGSITGDGVEIPLITSPALPGNYSKGGPRFATLAANGKEVYLTGFYEAGSTNQFDPVAPTGLFWSDGKIFKINLQTGVTSALVSLSGVPVMHADRASTIGPGYAGSGATTCAAFHGTAIDNAGHIFACDRLNGRIGIYDTLGTLVGQVPVKFAENVAWDNATGALFVVSRIVTGYHSGHVRLYKFASTTATAPACSVTICTNGMGEGMLDKTFLGLAHAGGKAIAWVGYMPTGVQAYRDDGSAFAKIKDFDAENQNVLVGFERVDVDRRSENTYIQDSWFGFYQVTDWNTPVIRPCTTSTGARLYGGDFAVSPDHQFYVREGTGYNGPIKRYDLADRHAPIPFPNTGTNVLTPYIYSRYGVGYGEHGFDVSPVDKGLGIMYMKAFAAYFVGILGDSAQRTTNDTTGVVDTIISGITGGYVGCGGVRFDTKGNLYFGVNIRNAQHVVPAGFASDWGYQRGVGGIVRMPRGAKGAADVSKQTVTGSDYIYKPAVGPFSGTSGECQCRAARFDIDPYDRLFIPSVVTQQITVVDNNDNPILQFGEYGNVDSKGAGSAVPTTGIPFAWPICVAASDNYMYVNDLVNTRMVRVKMGFALDNMNGAELYTDDYAYPNGTPNSAVSAPVAPRTELTSLSADPNPFNPSVTLRLSNMAGARVSVYNAAGQKVASLAASASRTSRLTWNAQALPSGVYTVRVVAGRTIKTLKITLLK